MNTFDYYTSAVILLRFTLYLLFNYFPFPQQAARAHRIDGTIHCSIFVHLRLSSLATLTDPKAVQHISNVQPEKSKRSFEILLIVHRLLAVCPRIRAHERGDGREGLPAWR